MYMYVYITTCMYIYQVLAPVNVESILFEEIKVHRRVSHTTAAVFLYRQGSFICCHGHIFHTRCYHDNNPIKISCKSYTAMSVYIHCVSRTVLFLHNIMP